MPRCCCSSRRSAPPPRWPCAGSARSAGPGRKPGSPAPAVFEDTLEVAVRVARRLGWTGGVAAESPPYQASHAYQLISVPTAVLVNRAGTVVGTVTGWTTRPGGSDRAGGHAARRPADGPRSQRAAAQAGVLQQGRRSARTWWRPWTPGRLRRHRGDVERGWTDGLPVVPPTADRVEAMLGGCDGRCRSASSRPTWVRRRWRGWPPARCWPAPACLLPGRCRGRQAALDPAFNLHGQAVTTQRRPARGGQRAGPGGDRAEQRHGRARPGIRANLTIGRALRLLVTLTGGGMPGRLDRATLGQMGKIGFCVAEDEEVSPWEPLHVERGFQPGQSVVTVIGSDAPLSISDHRSRTPEDLGWVLAWAAASSWSTNWWPLAEPSVFVICPEHAEMFRAAGWPSSACASSCSRRCTKRRRAAPRRDDAGGARRRPGRAGAQVGIASGDRADRGRGRGRALLCSPGPMHRHGTTDRLYPGGGVTVAADYVSPFDGPGSGRPSRSRPARPGSAGGRWCCSTCGKPR